MSKEWWIAFINWVENSKFKNVLYPLHLKNLILCQRMIIMVMISMKTKNVILNQILRKYND